MTTTHHHRRIPTGGQVERFYPPPDGPMDTPWTIAIYNAAYEPERWRRYNGCANRSYASRGLQAVGEEQVIDIERYPTYFAEATMNGEREDGLPIGGARMHMPDNQGGVPLLDELSGFIDISVLAALAKQLRPQGLAHGGGLWIDPDHGRSGLAADLARSCSAMVAAVHARWCVAATHQHILSAWRSLGWHPVQSIPTFAYPDERYRSCVLLGDSKTWPDVLTTWAHAQAGAAALDGPGPRFEVRPMRAVGSNINVSVIA